MTIGRRRAMAGEGQHSSLGTHGGGAGLRRLRGALLVQTWPSAARQVARWADRPGGGIVLTGRDGLTTARELLDAGTGCPVLVDAARYMRARTHRRTRLSESWVEWQRATGLPVALTDTSYIGPGDGEALSSVLSQAASFGPGVVAVLPVHASWLVDDIDRLCAEVAATEIPVALVIEHGGDPLGHPSIVDGLLRLMLLGVPVMVLRADVSALGMLCFGGYSAAVGLRDSLRRGPARRTRTDRAGVLVPQLLRFVDPNRLDAAMLANPQSAARLWRCDCEACDGTELSWLGGTDEPDEAADAHTIAALLRLRGTALASGAGSGHCQDGWAMRCAGATRSHDELAALLYGLPPQPALGTWAAAAGVVGLGYPPSSATNRS